MKVRYQIRPKNEKESYVQLYVTDNGNKLRFTTPYLVNTTDWAKGFPKAKNSTAELRQNLNSLELAVDKYINSTIENKGRKPTKNEIADFISQVMGNSSKHSLKSLYTQYLEVKTVEVKKVTLQQIENTFSYLFDYSRSIELPDLNRDLAGKFVAYLKKAGLQNVSINKQLKNIKAFLNWAYLNDYTQQQQSKYFKSLEAKDKLIIALNESELSILENAKVSNRLEQVRVNFLFAVYSGLRFKDVQRVRKDMITNNVLLIRQEKTEQFVSIPLMPEAVELLERYNYQLPHISNQKTNIYLKELFAELELNRPVLVSKQAGRELNDTYQPLSKVVTSHIARKSFITLALSRGIPAKIVQQVSGHRKDSVFNQYIAFSNETLATEMQKMTKSNRHLKKVI